MRFPIRFFPEDTTIDFMRWRWVWFSISLALIAATFALLFTRGLNLGIDFTGGILLELRTEQPAKLAPMRKALAEEHFGEVSLQHFGDTHEVIIRIQNKEDADQAAIVSRAKEVLTGLLGEGVEFRKTDYVGPTVGKELVRTGVLSLGIALLAIMVYVWFRFEWQFGIGAIAALFHDAVMVLGFYLVTGYDFGLTSIAAILTIIGYSINDTVVIYDRIRENMRRYKQMPLEALINRSLNETLSRTVLTAGTTLLAALALTLFGGEIIKGFSAALLFGVAAGTYSSIYISAPVLIYLGVRPDLAESGATPA